MDAELNMNVGRLRKVLEDFPDDAAVLHAVVRNDGSTFVLTDDDFEDDPGGDDDLDDDEDFDDYDDDDDDLDYGFGDDDED